MRRLAAAVLLFSFGGQERVAHADEAPASVALKGFRWVLKPGFTYQKPSTSYVPPVNQDVSFAVSDHIGYAIPIGPIVLSPGASVPVYFFDAGATPGPPGATLAVLGEVEVHLPLRRLSVYGLVGAGAAFYFASNLRGGVFRGGGGVTLYPASWIGVGMQASYLAMSNAARGINDGIEALEMVWPIELRF